MCGHNTRRSMFYRFSVFFVLFFRRESRESFFVIDFFMFKWKALSNAGCNFSWKTEYECCTESIS